MTTLTAGLLGRSLPFFGDKMFAISGTLAKAADRVGKSRALRVRLTSETEYRPCWPDSGSGLYCTPERPPAAADLKHWRKLHRSLLSQPNALERADVSQATALLYLAWPKLPGATEKAISALQRARELAGRANAAILNDLACAYLLKAQDGSASFRVRSLEAIEQAFHADPARPEVLFNRALILEALSLFKEARRSWSMLLELETDPSWLAEARRHLERLDQELAHGNHELKSDARAALAARDADTLVELARVRPRGLRLFVEEDLLPLWAEAIDGDLSDATERLLDIRMTGQALAQVTGDELLSKTATVLAAVREHGPDASRELARAHLLYLEGRRFYDGRSDFQQAGARFDQAAGLMGRWNSPFRRWPEFYSALCRYRRSKTRGLESFLRLAEETAEQPFPVLRGHILWMVGLAYYHTARLEESTAAYLAALEDFRAAADVEGEAAMLSQLSLNALRANDPEAGWNYRLTALDLLPRLASQRRIGNLLEMLVLGATADGLFAAALRFQARLDETALSSPQPILSANAWRRRARLAHQAELREEVLYSLAQARLAARRIPLEETREIVEGQILLAEAEVRRPSDPGAALRILERAIHWLERNDQHLEVMAAQRQSGLALRDLGDTAGAIHQLEQALTIGLQNSFEGDHRKAFFRHAQGILGDLIDVAADQDDADAAFRYHERSRLLALRSALGFEGSGISRIEPLSLTRITRRLPAGTVLLSFRFMDDELLVWTGREDTTLERLKVGESTLEPLVRRLRRGMHDGRESAELPVILSRLHAELIQPLEPRLRGATAVLVQPDRLLYGLPFAALLDESGRYLVERFAIGVVPSASLWYARSQGAATSEYQHLVAIGDPAYAAASYPDLEPLSHALEEAMEVAGLYPEPYLLTKSGATRDGLIEALGQAEIVHYSGHAVHRPEKPGASALVLARDPDTGDAAGELTAADIRRLRLAHVALVVLSTCDSGAASTLEREGNHNLASAFYLAGVPSVLASLWRLNDRLAIDFALEFHRRIRSGETPLQSLAQTQRAAIHGDLAGLSAPEQWAGYQLFGGKEPIRPSVPKFQ